MRRFQSPLGLSFLRSHFNVKSVLYMRVSHAWPNLPPLCKHPRPKTQNCLAVFGTLNLLARTTIWERNGHCTGQSQRIPHRSPCTCPSNLSLDWRRVLRKRFQRAASPPSLPLAFCVCLALVLSLNAWTCLDHKLDHRMQMPVCTYLHPIKRS